MEKTLKVGDRIFSPYFKKRLIITRIVSDDEWYFVFEKNELRAETPLNYFNNKAERR